MNLAQVEMIRHYWQPTSKMMQTNGSTSFVNFDPFSMRRINIYIDCNFFEFELNGLRHRDDGPAQIYLTQYDRIRLNWMSYGNIYKSIAISKRPIPLDLFKDFNWDLK